MGRSRWYGKPTRRSASSTRGQISVGRHAPVLQPERDVVAAAGHDQLGLRVLEDDADPFPGLARVEPVDLDGALRLAGVLGEQPGERGEQGALAGPGGAEQQHPLAVLDAQVDAADRPGAAPGVPPAEPAQLDAGSHVDHGSVATPARGVRPRRVRRGAFRPAGTGPARRSGPGPGSAASAPSPAITAELTTVSSAYGMR